MPRNGRHSSANLEQDFHARTVTEPMNVLPMHLSDSMSDGAEKGFVRKPR